MKRSIFAHFFCAFLLFFSHSLYSRDIDSGYHFALRGADSGSNFPHNWRNCNNISGGPADSVDFFCPGATARLYAGTHNGSRTNNFTFESYAYNNLCAQDKERCAQVCTQEIHMHDFTVTDWCMYHANRGIAITDVDRTAHFFEYEGYRHFFSTVTQGYTDKNVVDQFYAYFHSITPERLAADQSAFGRVMQNMKNARQANVSNSYHKRSEHDWAWLLWDRQALYLDAHAYKHKSFIAAMESHPDHYHRVLQVFKQAGRSHTAEEKFFRENATILGIIHRDCPKNKHAINYLTGQRALALSHKEFPVVRAAQMQMEPSFDKPSATVCVQEIYQISDNTRQTLQAYDIDIQKYEQCFGNQAQQEVHSVLVSESQEAADVCCNVYALRVQQDIAHQVIDYADIGIDLTHDGHVEKAWCIADFCRSALDLGIACADAGYHAGEAIVLGVGQAGCNSVASLVHIACGAQQAVVHPIESYEKVAAAAQKMMHALEYVMQNVVGIKIEICGRSVTIGENRMAYLQIGNGPPLLKMSPEIQTQLIASVHNATLQVAQYAHDHPYDAIREVTAFGSEFFISGAITNVAMKAAAQAYAAGKKASFGKNSLQVLDRVRKDIAFRPVATTPEGVKLKAPTMTHLMEGTEGAGQKAALKAPVKVTEKVEQEIVHAATESEKIAQVEQKIVPAVAKITEEAVEAPAYTKPGFSAYDITTFNKMQEVNDSYKAAFAELGLDAITKSDLKHIAKNHMQGGQFAVKGDRSVFDEGVNVVELAVAGLKNSAPIASRTIICDTGKVVGVTIDGLPTTKIEIWLNGNLRSIKTVYPCS